MMIKTAGLLLTLLAAMAASAQTNQTWPTCRYPVRVFTGPVTVNLTPLFQWWSHQPLTVTPATNADTAAEAAQLGAERPLPAWQRITGTKAGAAGSNWVVNAVIFTSPTIRTNARIILNHPPAVEEQTFYALKSKLIEAGQQIATAQHSYQASTNAAQRNEASARAWIRSGSKVANLNANNLRRLAAQKRQAATAALNLEQQLKTARAQLQKQLNAIPSVKGEYHLDWFAMAVGQTKAGVPIYDLGGVNFTAP